MIICFAIWRILAEQTFLTEIVGHRPITSGLRKVSLSGQVQMAVPENMQVAVQKLLSKPTHDGIVSWLGKLILD